MKYDALMSTKASLRLAKMPLDVVNKTQRGIDELREDHVGRSSKPHPDYREANYPHPRGQMYEIEWESSTHFNIVTILFCYAQNEKDTFIIDIVHASMLL